MNHAKSRWLGLLACGVVFWAGLICLLLAIRPEDTAAVRLEVTGLTVSAASSPDRPDDWRDWYEVRYTLENQSDRSLPLDEYDLVYTAGGDTLYPWTDSFDAVLSARPVLPAGRAVEVCHLLYLGEGESARVKLRYESWALASNTLAEFTLGG